MKLYLIAAGAIALAAQGLASPVLAQPHGDDYAAVPVERLKAGYLACDRMASRSVLDTGTAHLCSEIAEALLQRGFAGDFDGLLAWWRAARQAPPVASAR